MNNFDIGKCFFSLGNYQKAINCFKLVPDNFDKYNDSLYFRAFCLVKLNQSREALRILKTLLNAGYMGYNEDFSCFIYNIGFLYCKLGYIKKAYLYMKYALACDNNSLEFIPNMLKVENIVLGIHQNRQL
ncbi:tetratricopeptide repeat protein [Clostridium tyrobutyricum]|uniref:tetratricopeptide repeat protein n=1 Tax=Clostridium tyrobutyricum TaxID=1519 RepID=UPI0011CA75D5|nr:tetratricopeptide repeat protein [Clostridium tyrobutyricum]